MELQSVFNRVDEDHAVLRITIDAENVNTLIDQFAIALAYRKNITPSEKQSLDEAAVEALGKSDFTDYLRLSIMNHTFPFAAEAAKMEIVGKPTFHKCLTLTRGKAYTFEALCILKPSFSLASYDPVEISIPPSEVTDQDIEQYLGALAQSNSYLEEDTSHSNIRKGDLVELAIETYKDDVRCDQLCSESRTYTTGADLMPAMFDEEVMKMHVGETKTIAYDCPGFTLDENFEPETEHYTSTVTVLKAQKTIIPELNDEWVHENMPELEGFQGLVTNTRKTISERKLVEYRHHKNLLAANELVKRFDGVIPEAVYEVVVDDILHSFEEQLVQQNISKDEFLRQQGISVQQLMTHLTGQVHEQLVRQFALDSVAEHFKLEVNEEDLDEYFRAAASPGLEAMIRLDFERNGRMQEAHRSALRLKANDYITEHAIIHLQ